MLVLWYNRHDSQVGLSARPAVHSPGAALGLGANGPSGPHDASLTFKFQMHTKKRILLKMFCFVFFFPNMFLPSPLLCLKDELSVIFSQSFLLTNLGKVNGSVHALLSPPRLSGSWHLSPWGVSVCVQTGHCEVCDSYTLCPIHPVPQNLCVF